MTASSPRRCARPPVRPWPASADASGFGVRVGLAELALEHLRIRGRQVAAPALADVGGDLAGLGDLAGEEGDPGAPGRRPRPPRPARGWGRRSCARTSSSGRRRLGAAARRQDDRDLAGDVGEVVERQQALGQRQRLRRQDTSTPRRTPARRRPRQRSSPVKAWIRWALSSATDVPEGSAPSYWGFSRAISRSASEAVMNQPPCCGIGEVLLQRLVRGRWPRRASADRSVLSYRSSSPAATKAWSSRKPWVAARPSFQARRIRGPWRIRASRKSAARVGGLQVAALAQHPSAQGEGGDGQAVPGRQDLVVAQGGHPAGAHLVQDLPVARPARPARPRRAGARSGCCAPRSFRPRSRRSSA